MVSKNIDMTYSKIDDNLSFFLINLFGVQQISEQMKIIIIYENWSDIIEVCHPLMSMMAHHQCNGFNRAYIIPATPNAHYINSILIHMVNWLEFAGYWNLSWIVIRIWSNDYKQTVDNTFCKGFPQIYLTC